MKIFMKYLEGVNNFILNKGVKIRILTKQQKG